MKEVLVIKVYYTRFSQKNRIESVLHFAGLKSVAESTRLPLHYYNTNVSATLNLVEAMLKMMFVILFSALLQLYMESQIIYR